MALYASLVSFSQTIQKINSNQAHFPLRDLERELLDHLQQLTNSLLAHLNNDPLDRNPFIRWFNYKGEEVYQAIYTIEVLYRAKDTIEELYRAEDTIEELMSNQFLSNDNPRSSTNVGSERHQNYMLQDMAERLGYSMEQYIIKLSFFEQLMSNDNPRSSTNVGSERHQNYVLQDMAERFDYYMKQYIIELSFFEQFMSNDIPRSSADDDWNECRYNYMLKDMANGLDYSMRRYIIKLFMSEQFMSNDNPRSSTNVGSERHQSYLLRIWEVLQSMANCLGFKLKSSSTTSSSSRLAHTSNNVIEGLEDDLMKIEDWLTRESSKLQVIPIVGMGGIGKTTLATNVYDDSLIVEQFTIRVWVKVSQNYDAGEFLSNLIVSNNSFDKSFCEQSIDEMKLHVYQTLIGRRYLVVVDDMWSTDVWDHVMNLFPDNNNGSRIILTTRLLDVANYVDPSGDHHHIMHLMDEYQSWNLLQNKVFPAGITCPLELVSTGLKIATCCGGLPLAIVLTAGLLSTVNQDLDAWENIKRNISLHKTTEYERIEEILLLSYTNLPHYLRPCFLYMGAFPEDYEIHVSKLIKLCVAEGFLEPIESKSLEEWAEECLENLFRRNLIMVNKRKSNGKTKSYILHDLVRQTCIRKAGEEGFLFTKRTEIERYYHRRVSISSNSDFFRDIYGIHTIISFQNRSTFFEYLENCRLLRVLDAIKATFYMFPAEVSNLFHLRFLAFSYTTRKNMFFIPEFILHLWNLQTLMVHSDTRSLIQPKSVYLPIEIWNMANLRHLVSFVLRPLPDPPARTPPLENLQTLSVVTNFNCTEEMLLMIPNLRKLGIFYDGERESWPNYHLNNLVNLSQLEKLSITVIDRVGDSRSLLEGFVSPTSLKKLTLRGCKIRWEDFGHISWPNLQVLKLRNDACEGNIWITTEDKYPQLRVLMIETTNLRIWETESGHFPVLETLQLYGCDRLREIPEDIGNIMTLTLIEVDGRNRSVLESADRIREEQESFGNYDLQVRSSRA